MKAAEEFDIHLQHLLDRKKSAGLLRTLINLQQQIDFSSNDYFGLSTHPSFDEIKSNQLAWGATGSRSITGNSLLAEETEKQIAQFHERSAALLFNTGYMANIGLFSSLAEKGDTYIADELIHASMIDGMRLSHANRLKFKHNDLQDLEKKLLLASGKKIVAVESIYSMDGDMAPLNDIADLCDKHGALLIVDEAHATGIYGEKGQGLVHANHLEKRVYACIHTFGKALGLHGAAITGSEVLRNFLINQARSFIYTTALPPHSLMQIQKAYELIASADRFALQDLIAHFNTRVTAYSNIQFLKSESPIQGIVFADNFLAKNAATHLQEKGFFVKAILSPTVPAGKERIRICLHTFNTKEQIDDLLIEINSFLNH